MRCGKEKKGAVEKMEFMILSNQPIAKSVYKMVLAGDTRGIKAGQFVELALPGRFLRRPISVCDWTENTLTLIYKVVGVGTEDMTQMQEGVKLDVLTALGNGYDLDRAGDAPVLIGGGVGVPPMYGLARELCRRGIIPTILLGFNTIDEVFYEAQFLALGCTVYVATADGSYGTKGFVTDVLREENLTPSYYYTCGPLPMLRAVANATVCSGEASFEERMGCGFGACMGCTILTTQGPKRVCKDGPVFQKEEIEWQS